MGHDPIARRALAGMDGPHSPRPDMTVGEVSKVEHVAPFVRALDDYARPYGVDHDRLGGLFVAAVGPIIVAGELHPVALAELLFHLDECLGLSSIPASWLPVVRLAALGDEPNRAALSGEGLHLLADHGARPALLRLSECDDVAALIAGGAVGLGTSQPARLQEDRDNADLAERAVVGGGCTDGVGQRLPALAGGVDHWGPRALVAGQRGDVTVEDGLAGWVPNCSTTRPSPTSSASNAVLASPSSIAPKAALVRKWEPRTISSSLNVAMPWSWN